MILWQTLSSRKRHKPKMVHGKYHIFRKTKRYISISQWIKCTVPASSPSSAYVLLTAHSSFEYLFAGPPPCPWVHPCTPDSNALSAFPDHPKPSCVSLEGWKMNQLHLYSHKVILFTDTTFQTVCVKFQFYTMKLSIL